jgi:hypothetical protein
MLDTYIKKQGVTQTILHNNNKNHFNQINWDADYDGNIANISVNSNINGKRDRFNITLDNEDLADILNIPSVNMPIDKRLELDFQGLSYRPESFLEFPTRLTVPELEPRKSTTIKEIINRGISSPAQNEELIVPLTIDKKTMDDYVLTPNKRHRRRKSHITHKVYKKNKSSNKSSIKSKVKTRSMRKTL